MPLEDKNWKFALGTASTSRGWIVRLTSDSGHVGYGYANSSPHMGSTFESLPQELERFKPHRRSARTRSRSRRSCRRSTARSPAAARPRPASTARCTTSARARSACRSTICSAARCATACRCCASCAIKTPAEMAANAGKLLEQGYRYFKIKVHGEVDEDVARVKAIRERVGAGRPSHHRRQPVLFAEGRDHRHQPHGASIGSTWSSSRCRAHDLKGLELVTRSVPVTVEADEGAGTIDEIMTLVGEPHRRCGQPQDPEARRPAQRARGRAHLRGRHT